MKKRMTDCDKWDDEWFMGLPMHLKLFWIFICDKCDDAGVWKVNWPLACLQIGHPLDRAEVERIFCDPVKPRIRAIAADRWWITGFCSFQYKTLAESCKGQSKAWDSLREHNLLNEVVSNHRSVMFLTNSGGSFLPEDPTAASPPKESNPATGTPTPGIPESAYPQTPELTTSKKDTGGGRKNLRKADRPYSEEFETFWRAYPRKEGKGKAWEAWQSVSNKPDLDSILQAVERYQETDQWNRDGGKYIPHPTTWINQRRWDDQPEGDDPYEDHPMYHKIEIPEGVDPYASTLTKEEIAMLRAMDAQKREAC